MTRNTNTIPRLGLLAAALAATLGLSACAPLLIGGAVSTAVSVADRRTTGTQIEDEGIELKSANRLRETLGNRGHVNITSYDRVVLLTGEVPSDSDRSAAEQAVRRVENVRSVDNEIAVMPNSSLGSRSNDALLTTKVKATYVDAKDLQANAIKVVTERGVVYLMGKVTEREAKRAADLAAGVSGVQKVVRVFDVVTEDELAGIQRMQQGQPPAEPKQ
jgi:osmotically-inducible protein OsmY